MERTDSGGGSAHPESKTPQGEGLNGGLRNQEAPTSRSAMLLIWFYHPPARSSKKKAHSCEQVKCVLDWSNIRQLDQPWVQTQTNRQHDSASRWKEKLNP